jgi:phage tail tape-measure protein
MTKRTRKLLSFVTLLVLGGCATMPTGPSVNVLPTPGKPFEQFMAEDSICRQWAERQVGTNAQETANQNTATGAVVGTLIGAGAGAALGAAAGNPGAGAAIGGGSGLLLGTASGASYGQAYGSEAQRRYDNTYVQCMYAKGNQVPGTVRRVRRVRTAPPPPPTMYSVPPDYYPPR